MRIWKALRTLLIRAGWLVAVVAFTHCAGRPLSEDVAADLIFFNGKIITVDSDLSIASALAIKNDKFLTLGQDDEVLSWAGSSTQTVDLQGKTVTPGFIDSPIHAIRASVRPAPAKKLRRVMLFFMIYSPFVRIEA